MSGLIVYDSDEIEVRYKESGIPGIGYAYRFTLKDVIDGGICTYLTTAEVKELIAALTSAVGDV